MALELPIIPIQQTFKPNTATPKDLSHLISAFGDDYTSSFMKARGVADEGIIGNSRANAQAARNRAAYETANQDTIDQTGAPGRPVAPSARPGVDLKSYTTPELLELLNRSGTVPAAQV